MNDVFVFRRKIFFTIVCAVWMLLLCTSVFAASLRSGIAYDANFERALLLCQEAESGDYTDEERLVLLNKAILFAPTLKEAYVQRGVAHLTLDHFREAINDYTSAISLAPDDKELYLCRGDVYLYFDNFLAAVADYEKGLDFTDKYDDNFPERMKLDAMRYQVLLQHYRQVGDAEKRDRTVSMLLELGFRMTNLGIKPDPLSFE